jgi:hypothetical protein
MQVDDHESMRHVIDKSLAGAASVEEEQALREHLPTCDGCRDYLAACNCAIASLEGLRFKMDPGLDGKVLASLALRSRQLDAERIHRRRMWWGCVAALVLTVVGSFAASRLGSLAGAIFHLEPARIQFGLATFWITPSWCFCLLFLLLFVSPVLWRNEKGLSL